MFTERRGRSVKSTCQRGVPFETPSKTADLTVAFQTGAGDQKSPCPERMKTISYAVT